VNQSVYIEQQNYSLEINQKHIKPQALNELEAKSSGQQLQPSFHSAILLVEGSEQLATKRTTNSTWQG
jgi:hypothetical protein